MAAVALVTDIPTGPAVARVGAQRHAAAVALDGRPATQLTGGSSVGLRRAHLARFADGAAGTRASAAVVGVGVDVGTLAFAQELGRRALANTECPSVRRDAHCVGLTGQATSTAVGGVIGQEDARHVAFGGAAEAFERACLKAPGQ